MNNVNKKIIRFLKMYNFDPIEVSNIDIVKEEKNHIITFVFDNKTYQSINLDEPTIKINNEDLTDLIIDDTEIDDTEIDDTEIDDTDMIIDELTTLTKEESFVEEVEEEVIEDKKPRGWHFRKVFVDKFGNVYHKGVIQPELKGTLPSDDY